MRQITLCFLVFIIVFDANAQLRKVSTDAIAKSEYQMSLSFQPLFLLNNTIRLDYELQQKEKSAAFIGGLELITGNTSLLYRYINDDDNTLNKDDVSGVGLNLAYKYKLEKSDKITSFYVSPGITLRKVQLNTKGEDFYTYQENGVEYYTYGLIEKKYNINSALIFGNLGYQKVWNTGIMLDTYLGFGYKTTTRNSKLEVDRDYEKPFYVFNFNGFGLQVGLRFGYQIKL